ncbi:MAG: cupin domain-containing protein [Pseudomonadota bacterium]
MKILLSRLPLALAFAGGLLLAVAPDLLAGTVTGGEAKITPVMSEALPNLPGNRLTAVLVEYGPGGKSAAHHHAGSVMAYVIEGAIRSQVSGGEARVYRAGESFFEPPGSRHLVSENASQTEPAKLIAIIVAPEGAKLTVFDK